MATSSPSLPSLARSFDLPYLTDWYTVALRWVLLQGLTLLMANSGWLTQGAGLVLAAGAIWNLVVPALAIFNRRPPHHRLINVVIDILISSLLFILAPGLMWPLGWSGLLVIGSAATYYSLKRSVAIILGLGLIETTWIFFHSPSLAAPENIGLKFGSGILAALTLGYLSNIVLGNLHRSYQATVDRRKANQQAAQKQERERVNAFYYLIETLSATLDYRVLLQSALDLSAIALGDENSPAAQMVGAVLLFENRNLVIGSGRRLPADDMALSFPATSGVLRQAIETGVPKLITNPSQDSELESLSVLQNCQSALCLPVQRGLNAYGIMLFAHPDPDFFSATRSELLEMVCHQAVIAIQNARLYEDLASEKQRALIAQEEATKKLARDLHDGPTQSVTGIAMRINIARRLLECDAGEAKNELDRAEGLARRTVSEIRHMLFTLRPLVLESKGLVAALQAISEKMLELYQQNVQVEVDPMVVEQIDPNTQTTIFYLVEETVNNARKHAQAEHIWVRLGFLPENCQVARLSISDDGVGFNLEEVLGSYEKRGSLGMVNLRERTDMINGLLRIDTAPSKGTSITVLIPLTCEARLVLSQMPHQV